MTTAIFIVIFSRERWWVDLNGKSRGPFVTRDTAELEALSLAKIFSADGRRSEVQVVEPGKRNKIIWQSATQGLLGRTAALVNH